MTAEVRTFEITGIIDGDTVRLVDRRGRTIKSVPLTRVAGKCESGRESTAYSWRVSFRKMLDSWKGHASSHCTHINDPWKRKSATLANAWNKRWFDQNRPVTKRRVARSSAKTWYAACRHMHAKHLQKVERSQKGEDWGSWCNNVSSNQRKRVKFLSMQEARSQASESID